MTEIAGRPVRGKPLPTRSPQVEQWGADKFIELLDALLVVPRVEAVRWRQYTPYFNDGDACEFHVVEFTVRIADTDGALAEWQDGFYGEYNLAPFDREAKRRIPHPEFADIYTAWKALEPAAGHCEEFLGESFGDHAQVTATSEGFDIEFYDHD